jgi:carboxymethylenebutenolidase
MTAAQPQGFLATPAKGSGPGVLVLHAWWGLNHTIKALCNRLADNGFVAFAPDLYHGQVADKIPDAEALMKALNKKPDQAHADVTAAIEFLASRADSSQAGLGVIGFSLGAMHALEISAADPEHIRRVVVYYGNAEGVDFSTSKASYLGHFAQWDDFAESDYSDDPERAVRERAYIDALEKTIRDAGRPVTFHHYPGTGHWFAEPDRVDAYNEAAANLAWDRTLAFLK